MFQFAMIKKIMNENQNVDEINRNSIPQLETESLLKRELSPKTKRIKEHKMNRIQSMDNFMKFSWSWTL